MSSENLAHQIVAAKSTKRDTKEMIYEASLRLFATHSYARTGLRDIAAAVGIEVATIYSHVANKNELLFDLMDFGHRDLLRRLTAATELPSSAAPSRLYALVREHVAINCRRRYQTLVAFNELRELSPEQREQILAIRASIETLYVDCIDVGMAQHQFRSVDVRLAVFGIISMGRGAASWYRDDGRRSPEEIGEVYADLAIRGLLSSKLREHFGDEPITAARLSIESL